MKNRVVITGIGVISPIGIGKEQFFSGLINGKNGISSITGFDTSLFNSKNAFEVKDLDAAYFLGKKGLRYYTKSSKFAISAACLAIEDAKLKINNSNENDIGIIMGTTFANLHSAMKFDMEGLTDDPRFVNPMLFPNTMLTTPVSQITIKLGIKGMHKTISNGQTSANDALTYAYDLIKTGEYKIMLSGGVEELSWELFAGFYSNKLLSGSTDNKEELCAPFDKRRNGMILGEGSAILVLENYEHAIKRGANIYAEVAGVGNFFEPDRMKKKDGLKTATKNALEDAQVGIDDIDYLCANANSHIEIDQIEAQAINDLFGYKTSLKIGSIKASIGEILGASGAMQLSASSLAISNRIIPPTLNYQEKDTDCSIENIVTKKCEYSCNTVIVNSFGLGGSYSSIILKGMDS